MLIGYARVSKGDDQSDALQLRALEDAGCERIFSEAVSGGRWDRPELLRLLDQLRSGDEVVVWKLDRLSRSMKEIGRASCRERGCRYVEISVVAVSLQTTT